MIPKNRIQTHPGEILLEEFLLPMEMSDTAGRGHGGSYSKDQYFG